MIKRETVYHITLTQDQLKELYQLLQYQKDQGLLTYDHDLMALYMELKQL